MRHMVHKLLKYYVIAKRYLSLSIQKILEYRMAFLLDSLSILLWMLLDLIWVYLAFQYTDSVGGYSVWEYLTFLGFYLVGLNSYLFIFHALPSLQEKIYYGDIDLTLTKPMNSRFLVSIGVFDLQSIPSMLIGTGVIIFAFIKSGHSFDIYRLSVALYLLVLSVLIFYSIEFSFHIITFWYGKARSVSEVFKSLRNMSKVPTNLFKPVLEFILYFVFPVAIMATVPADIIFGRIQYNIVVYYTVLAVVLLVLSNFLWNYALRSYSSASS